MRSGARRRAPSPVRRKSDEGHPDGPDEEPRATPADRRQTQHARQGSTQKLARRSARPATGMTASVAIGCTAKIRAVAKASRGRPNSAPSRRRTSTALSAERDVARVHARGPQARQAGVERQAENGDRPVQLVGGGLVGGAPVLVGEGAQQGRLAPQHRGVAPHQHVIIEDELVPQGARAHQHRGQQHGDDGRRAGRQRAGSRQATHGAVVWALRTVTVLSGSASPACRRAPRSVRSSGCSRSL